VNDWRYWWNDYGPLFLIGGLLVLLFLVLPCVIDRAMFHGEVAEIESLRQDAQNIKSAESEDVRGQVVEVNRIIRKNQRYNQLWWSRWTVVNGWDDIEPIRLPEDKRGE